MSSKRSDAKYVSRTEAAQMLGVSVHTIDRMINSGELTAHPKPKEEKNSRNRVWLKKDRVLKMREVK